MARNVADVALMHSAITRGPELSPLDLRGVRIGVPRTPLWEALDPDIAKIMESALDRLRGAGAVVVDVNIDDLIKTAIAVRGALRREDFRNDLADFLAREYPSMTMKDAIPEIPSKRVRFLEEDARDHPPSREDVAKSKATMDALGPQYRDAFRQHNIIAIAYPTCQCQRHCCRRTAMRYHRPSRSMGGNIRTRQSFAIPSQPPRSARRL